MREARLHASAAGRPLPRQAPRLPIAVIVGMEKIVVAMDVPKYVRMYAWWRLVKV